MSRKENKRSIFSVLLNFLTSCVVCAESDDECIGQNDSRGERNRSYNCAEIKEKPSKVMYSRTRVFPLTHPVTKEMVARYMPETREPVCIVPQARREPEDSTESHGGPLDKNFWTVVSNWRQNCKAEKIFNYYAPALDRQDVHGVGAWAWVLSNAR